DDGPANNAVTISNPVHEDALDNYNPAVVLPGIEGSTGNDEGGKTTTVVLTYAAIATLVNFGADGAGAITLNNDLVSFDGSTVTGITSKGDAITWNVVSATEIHGVADDGRIIFKISQTGGTGTPDNPADDQFTFELLDQVDHLTALGDDDRSVIIDISTGFVAADGDGDTVVIDAGSLTVKVENDVPAIFYPEASFLFNSGAPGSGDAQTFELSFASAVGADEPGKVEFDTALINGQQVFDKSGQAIKFGGETLFYHIVATASGDTIVEARASGTNTLAFTITLDPATDTYIVDLEGQLRIGAEFDSASLVGISGGNKPGYALTQEPIDDGTGSDGVIATAADNGVLSTVNTSNGRFGVGGGQSLDSNDVIRFDFVTNVLPLATTQNGFDFDTHDPIKVFYQEINRINGKAKANFTIKALDADDDNVLILDGSGDSTIALSLNEVSFYSAEPDLNNLSLNQLSLVISGGGTIYTWTDPNDNTVSIVTTVDANGIISVVGLPEGYYYLINSNTPFDAVEIAGSARTGNFTLGGFTFEVDAALQSIDMELPIVGSDHDGDTVNSSIDIHIIPDDGTNQIGTDGIDSLTGDGNNNILAGLGGDDILSGGSGDDILAGGLGADTLTGGTGNDTFLFEASAVAEAGLGIHDVIVDYAAGDIVDLTDILPDISASGLSAYVRYDRDGSGADTNAGDLQVDVDGAGTGADWVTIANIQTHPTAVTILFNDDDPAAPVTV
ncbi:calcium-binding protein, partial [Oricola cellulosilytica]